MTALPTSLLATPGLDTIFALLDRDGEEARMVGGAVRNALMGLPIADIDIATTATPDIVMRRAADAGLRALPTGLDHGTDDGLPAALKEWLGIAQSPGVQSVRLNRPEGTVEITVDQNARDADLQALAKTFPDLDRAQWVLTGGNLMQTAPFAEDYPEAYWFTGMTPDAALRDLWKQIVAEVGAAGEVSAETDMSHKDIPTTVVVNFPTSRDREQNLAQAWMVLPLLQKLPQPAKVDFAGALFTIGGCSPGEAGRSTLPLEIELREKFEKC